jgi:hypothetical protein
MQPEQKPQQQFEIKDIAELVEGQSLFESNGYSVLKIVRRGQNGQNVLCPVRLPIKSAGVSEFMRKLSMQAPKPPAKKEWVETGSEEAEKLGMTESGYVMMFDQTDERYQDQMEKWDKDFFYQVAVFALDISWKTSGGEATTYEEKRRILESNGITRQHLLQIFQDVTLLTRFQEGRFDFLSEKPSA